MGFASKIPHPQPFPLRGKGGESLSLWERARVRALNL